MTNLRVAHNPATKQQRRPALPGVVAFLATCAAVLTGLLLLPASGFAQTPSSPCAPPVTNKVACENAQPGTAPVQWQTRGSGDPTIQGFATQMSVQPGETIHFKIRSDARFHFDILRLGYYNGDGARELADGLAPSADQPQDQPSCIPNSDTGLIDCGNWAESASYTVPSNAVSGLYIAHLVRDDTGGDSQILFVVRDDSATTNRSDILVSTSDATWQAYNAYGGNSLYSCTVSCPPGNPAGYKAAYAVSYNRPFDGTLTTDGGLSDPYYSEYQMIRFLEENGYDVSYTSQVDVDRDGAPLLNHRVFLSSGHDEYWSAGMRSHVEAARDAGVNLAFFSGNEAYWKTRYMPSNDGTNTAGRTLVSYKDTHFEARPPGSDPNIWTGTWMDPRFAPPTDGGQPQNALTGQLFTVNWGTSDITVPSTYKNLRFWRNTDVASLTSGDSLTLAAGTGVLGYEWDEDIDNGFRPKGSIQMSDSNVDSVQHFDDYGTAVTDEPAEHHLTLYRAPSGALVFGAGTVQWSWGLDDTNAWGQWSTRPNATPTDRNMQQATVNLLADMGAQPLTILPGLTPATKSTDTTAPTSTLSTPAVNSSVSDSSVVTISGTASDTGGGIVAGVEVSTDNGATWHRADGTTSWTYAWTAHGVPSATIKVRATDDSGNTEASGPSRSINVSCPCSLLSGTTPVTTDTQDDSSVEVGMKFRSDTGGEIRGVRFYKGINNTGTHTGTLWGPDGSQLATVTFQNETATGWQQALFSTPVPILANTTYEVSYLAPNGHYSSTEYGFYKPAPLGGQQLDAPPLHAIQATTSATNGYFAYGSGGIMPTGTYHASNYFVDVVFATTTTPGTPGTPTATAGVGSANVSWAAPTTGGSPAYYTVTPYIGTTAQTALAVQVTGSPLPTNTTVTGLTAGTSYTFKVTATNGSGTSAASAASNAVTPTALTVPGVPTGVTAVAKTGAAVVSWTAPSNTGGTAISSYTVTPYIGATAQSPTVSSGSGTSVRIGGLTNGTAYTFKVKATNSVGTGADSTASAAVTPQITIFDGARPLEDDSTDTNAVEVGVKFRSDASGTINALRFYKGTALNNGTHIGTLWSATGTRLASATYSSETSSGWQQVNLATPVSITAGTTYVVSYFAPSGHYSDTPGAFGSFVDNPPLHALSSATSPNGVYSYSSSSTFPTQSWNNSDYGVDVVFAYPVVTSPPGTPGTPTATAGNGSATVNWTAPGSGGTPASYTVTPYVGTTAQTALAVTVNGSPPATSTTVSGLTGGTSYTFKVQATNSAGSGPASAASNAVTPTSTTVPGTPTAVAATAAVGGAKVTWTAPSNGGSAITSSTVTPYIGTTAQTAQAVVVSGTGTVANVTGLTTNTAYTFKVKATNAIGTGAESSASGAVKPAMTIFSSRTPAVTSVGNADPNAVELGVKFTSDVAGSVTAIRFYKGTGNNGTHIGNLWSATGTRLASVTFSGETASGWQEQALASPLAITAGTTYVVSYFAPQGNYAATDNAFTTRFDNTPLHAPATSTTPNGVYAYTASSAFPTSSWNGSDYGVDVVFAPQ
jgi:Domain of unknown function (DUF4082)/Fibronectin type III domain